jgi:hypothetical protein
MFSIKKEPAIVLASSVMHYTLINEGKNSFPTTSPWIDDAACFP